MEAFLGAAESGCQMFECDVRKAGDGQFVIHHDPEIGGLAICDYSVETLRERSTELGYTVPTLAEVCEFARGKLKVDLELKEQGDEQAITEQALSFLAPEEIMITSFHDNSLVLAKRASPDIATGLLLGLAKPDNMLVTRFTELFPKRRIEKAACDVVLPRHGTLQFAFLKRMELLNVPVIIWTVNDIAQIRRYLLSRAVCGIITDDPDIAMSVSISEQFFQ